MNISHREVFEVGMWLHTWSRERINQWGQKQKGPGIPKDKSRNPKTVYVKFLIRVRRHEIKRDPITGGCKGFETQRDQSFLTVVEKRLDTKRSSTNRKEGNHSSAFRESPFHWRPVNWNKNERRLYNREGSTDAVIKNLQSW